MNNNLDLLSFKCKLIPLTPIHIGSGNEIEPYDYVIKDSVFYRINSMDIFEKLQLVKVLNTGEDSYRFDADTSEHAHVQCLECGRVDDVRIDPAEIREQAGRDSGYEVQKQEVYFYGVCPRCRSKKEAGAAGGGVAKALAQARGF